MKRAVLVLIGREGREKIPTYRWDRAQALQISALPHRSEKTLAMLRAVMNEAACFVSLTNYSCDISDINRPQLHLPGNALENRGQ